MAITLHIYKVPTNSLNIVSIRNLQGQEDHPINFHGLRAKEGRVEQGLYRVAIYVKEVYFLKTSVVREVAPNRI